MTLSAFFIAQQRWFAWPCLVTATVQNVQQGVAVAFELARADPRYFGQRFETGGALGADRDQGLVVQDHVGRDSLFLGSSLIARLAAGFATRFGLTKRRRLRRLSPRSSGLLFGVSRSAP